MLDPILEKQIIHKGRARLIKISDQEMDYDEKFVFGQLDDDKSDDLWERCVSQAIRRKTKEITSKVFKD